MPNEVFDWIKAIAQNLVASFLAVVIGIAFTYLVRRQWDRYRYGRWRVVVLKAGETKVDRPISVEKAKEILAEPSELSVFLKGVASPYGWINCDILDEGRKRGLLIEDHVKRVLTVDLDKNPKQSGVTNADVLKAVKQLSSDLLQSTTMDPPEPEGRASVANGREGPEVG